MFVYMMYQRRKTQGLSSNPLLGTLSGVFSQIIKICLYTIIRRPDQRQDSGEDTDSGLLTVIRLLVSNYPANSYSAYRRLVVFFLSGLLGVEGCVLITLCGSSCRPFVHFPVATLGQRAQGGEMCQLLVSLSTRGVDVCDITLKLV